MNAGRLLHLFVMAVPVAILTTFNLLGVKATPELTSALSALTTAAAAYAGSRYMRQTRPRPRPQKERNDAPASTATSTRTPRNRDRLKPTPAPARARDRGEL